MIVGFAHISKNISQHEFSNLLEYKSIDKTWIYEKNLVNAPEKNRLMLNNFKNHNLLINKPQRIEYLGYDYLEGPDPCRLNINGKLITLTTVDNTAELSFWRDFLSFDTSHYPDAISLHKPLSHWSVELKLKISTKKKFDFYPLDSVGYIALAFYVRGLIKIMANASNKGYNVSEIFELNIENKKLNIAYIRSPSNLIIELIEV